MQASRLGWITKATNMLQFDTTKANTQSKTLYMAQGNAMKIQKVQANKANAYSNMLVISTRFNSLHVKSTLKYLIMFIQIFIVMYLSYN